MNWKIPLFRIAWSEEDVSAVSAVIRRGMQWAIGPEIEQFEAQLAQYVGRKYAVSFANGTCALHAALLAHGIGPGDEVIVPSFTFISTANSALFVGAKPVFADIEEESYALDAEDVKERITAKTKAIMPIHYAGSPARDIKALKEIAEDKGLVFIEDAAESLGALQNGGKVGSFGDSAMFSFCANKIITTGEGGAVVTDSKETCAQLKAVRGHGRVDSENYFYNSSPPDYTQLGYNFRMSTMTAALGISQMNRLERNIAARAEVAKAFEAGLSDIKDVKTMKAGNGSRHVYQMYSVRFGSKAQKDTVKEKLAQGGVMAKTYFDPIHLTHFYKKVLKYDVSLPVTEDVSRTILSLPIYPELGKKDADYITGLIKSCRQG
jgi:dTDP-4-amino-4,6-dideoxygalactose transaminase